MAVMENNTNPATVKLVKTGDSRYDVIAPDGTVIGTVRKAGGHRIGQASWLGPVRTVTGFDGEPVERAYKFATRAKAVAAFVAVANGADVNDLTI